MRVYLLGIYLFFTANVLWGADEAFLKDTLKDYAELQKELDAILGQKTTGCNVGAKDRPLCSIKNICESRSINLNAEYIYQNDRGERIYNSGYLESQELLTSCLKEKFGDEIAEKKDDYLNRVKTLHLKKILEANKKLSSMVSAKSQDTTLNKISAEILNMSLNAGINNEDFFWEKENASKDDLFEIIKAAEQKTRLKLNTEIKNQLVEIQYLKNNPSYKQDLDKFEKSLVPERKSNDPFFNWDLMISEAAAGGKDKMLAHRDHLIKKSQEAYGTFKEASAELIDYLNSKKTAKNKNQIERIIERVRTIRFNPPRITETLSKHCSYPNAFYSARTHSFTLCPQMLEFPKMALMETIVHEISHSFDACTFSGKMYKSKGPSIMEEAPFEIDLKMDPIDGNYRTVIGEQSEGAKEKDKIQDKMKYMDHPFYETLSCLQGEKSVGAKSIDLGAIKEQADKELAELTRLGRNNKKNPSANKVNFLKEHLNENFDYFQGCDLSSASGSLLRSQLEEGLADKMASEVIARKMRDQSQSAAEKSITEIALGYTVCTDEGDLELKIRDYAKKWNCPNFFENKQLEQKIIAGIETIDPKYDMHSKSVKRIEKMILAHPETRKALHCPKDKDTKYCE